MSHETSSRKPSEALQLNRTADIERLFEQKFKELGELTDQMLRWPVPRPLVVRNLKRTLHLLSWCGKELTDSLQQDALLAGTKPETTPPATQPSLNTLDNNPAAEAVLAIIDDRGLTGSTSPDLLIQQQPQAPVSGI